MYTNGTIQEPEEHEQQQANTIPKTESGAKGDGAKQALFDLLETLGKIADRQANRVLFWDAVAYRLNIAWKVLLAVALLTMTVTAIIRVI